VSRLARESGPHPLLNAGQDQGELPAHRPHGFDTGRLPELPTLPRCRNDYFALLNQLHSVCIKFLGGLCHTDGADFKNR